MDRTAITNRVLTDMLGDDVAVVEQSNPMAVETANHLLGSYFDRLHLDSPDLALTEEAVEARLRGELSTFLTLTGDGLRKKMRHPALKHERLTAHDEFDGVKLTVGEGTITVRESDLDALEEVVALLKKETVASPKARKSASSKKSSKPATKAATKSSGKSVSKGQKDTGTSSPSKSTNIHPSVTKSPVLATPKR